MKTIFHSDYWIEIPAGEYFVGLSVEQRQAVSSHIFDQVGYEHLTLAEQKLMDSAVAKIRQQVERVTSFERRLMNNEYAEYPFVSMGLTPEEDAIISRKPLDQVFLVESSLADIPLPIPVFVDTFYIAKFSLTETQYQALLNGASTSSLPGALEEPTEQRGVARIQNFSVFDVLGCRAPNIIEWEKAARGLDGRLYPWGNQWNLQAGYFYTGQQTGLYGDYRVDEFPQSISPYGVWGMVGGIPEVVQARKNKAGVNEYYYTSKGCHAKESSEEMAWFDHILVLPGKGDWVSLRPVLDKWPQQQWTGFSGLENQP